MDTIRVSPGELVFKHDFSDVLAVWRHHMTLKSPIFNWPDRRILSFTRPEEVVTELPQLIRTHSVTLKGRLWVACDHMTREHFGQCPEYFRVAAITVL